MIVPGNHDINWRKCEGYFLDCEGDDTAPVPPYWPKFEPYFNFFQRFYGDSEDVAFPKDQPWTIFEIPELKTVVAGPELGHGRVPSGRRSLRPVR